MRQLIWKEWHEQRWKLGFGCIVLCAFALIGLHTRIIPDQAIIIATCAMGVLLLPVLSASGLVPAERGQGTLRTVLALPVAPWKVLAVKAAMGVLLCAGPLLAAAVISLLITRGRELSSEDMLAIYGRSILTGVCLFGWMTALTAGSPNEGRGTALAVGVLVCWLMLTSGLVSAGSMHLRSYGIVSSQPPYLLWATCPFVFVCSPSGVSVLGGLLVQAALFLAISFPAVRAMKVRDVEDKP
jgi:ABC-type transport system involved in multi-copper enzyme maturation permease subunit